jgi:hemolysin activation/secretion protein
MSVTTRNLILVLLLLLIVSRNQANAQVSTSPNAAPGAILQYNTQPWSLPGEQKPGMTEPPANQIPEREPEKPVDPVQIEDSQTPMKPDDRLEVPIQRIQVDGNSLLPSSQIDSIIRPYENRTLRFSDMETMASQITALYIKAGYINSQAYIPVQDFTNQTLHLRVIETKVNEILYEPARWFPPRGILPRIASKTGEPLNIGPLGRSIRLINENPDIRLQARLVQGKNPGTSNILLQGESRFPVHITPFMDNLGRSSIGNLRLGVTGNHNNLLGFGDTNTSVVSFTKRSFGLVNQYSFPIGPYGTRVGMNFAYSNVKLGGSLKPLDIHSRSQIFTPLFMQTLWKNDRAGLNATLGFDFKNLNTDLLDAPFHRDRLRVLRPSLDGYFNDRWGRTYLNQEVGIGLNILGGSTGSTALASKSGSGTRFLSLSGGITRVQKLPFGTTGVLRGYGMHITFASCQPRKSA